VPLAQRTPPYGIFNVRASTTWLAFVAILTVPRWSVCRYVTSLPVAVLRRIATRAEPIEIVIRVNGMTFLILLRRLIVI